MKKLLILPLFLLTESVFSQKIDTLFVNDDKFINLHFNSNVVLHQSSQPSSFFIESKGNILFIQALDRNVIESNLFVQSTNGENYNYIVRYTPKLQKIVYNYQTNSNSISREKERGEEVLEEPFYSFSTNPIANEIGYINSRNKATKGKVDIYLKGLYTHDDKLYVLLFVDNKSNLNYDIADIKAFIRPAKKLKNIAIQDEELSYKLFEKLDKVIAKDSRFITLEINKNALIDKVISIDLLEKHGDRNLNIQVPQEFIHTAKQIK